MGVCVVMCADFAPPWATIYQHLTEGRLRYGRGTPFVLASFCYRLPSNRQTVQLIHQLCQPLASHEGKGTAMEIINSGGEDALRHLTIDAWER